MAFTMHSHSGQFCPGHAKDQLEDIVKRAVGLNMRLIALTEHMPRTSRKDLYPEEKDDAAKNPKYLESMVTNHHAYIREASRLRDVYAGKIKILVGFECEWIRASDVPFIRELSSSPAVDLFLGSVHHVHGIPIDFDHDMYVEAREKSGGTDEALFEDYFDAQYDMLCELRPPVVAHFDLIRLYADERDKDLKTMPRVWKKVMRNLEYCSKQGLMVEVNSAAFRKGLGEPYPGRSVCEEFLKMEGKFTLSDDSHGIDQVGLNFKRVQQYLLDVGIKQLWSFERDANGDLADTSVQVRDLQLDAHPFTPQAQL